MTIFLSSESAELYIHEKKEESGTQLFQSMTITDDKTRVQLESVCEISLIHLVLVKIENEHKIPIQFLMIPFRGYSREEAFRIDSLFPFIFKEGERITSIPEDVLSLLPKDRNPSKFELILSLGAANSSSQYKDISVVAPTVLMVGELSVPVSKEVLALNSEFFATLFDGEYEEKQTGIFEIQDEDPEELRRFIQCFHSRQWTFSCGDQLLRGLRYADQYSFLSLVHLHFLPFLQSLPFVRYDEVNDLFLLCSRFYNCTEILKCILEDLYDERDMFKLVQDCVLKMPARSVQPALKALETAVADLKKEDISQEKVNVLKDTMSNQRASVHLLCHDEEGTMIYEDFFVVEYLNSHLHSQGKINLEDVWDKVPQQLNNMLVRSVNSIPGVEDGNPGQEYIRMHPNLLFDSVRGKIIEAHAHP